MFALEILVSHSFLCLSSSLANLYSSTVTLVVRGSITEIEYFCKIFLTPWWRHADGGFYRLISGKLFGEWGVMTNCHFAFAESQGFRIAFLVLGMLLLLMAPIVSDWVPFYYSSAMTLGVFLVIIVLLYQVRFEIAYLLHIIGLSIMWPDVKNFCRLAWMRFSRWICQDDVMQVLYIKLTLFLLVLTSLRRYNCGLKFYHVFLSVLSWCFENLSF